MDDKATFKPETVNRLLQLHFQDKQSTKVNGPGLKLLAEMMRVFVAEAAGRAAQQATAESSMVVQPEHLEKVLPQLLLDF